MKLTPLHDNIICSDGDFGDKVTKSGIFVQSSIGKSEGIIPRWFRVRHVGPKIDWLKPEQWVLVQFGRWTEGFEFDGEKYWKVDPEGCLLVSEEKPDLEEISFNTDVVTAAKKEFY